jgi:hypothetical protein
MRRGIEQPAKRLGRSLSDWRQYRGWWKIGLRWKLRYGRQHLCWWNVWQGWKWRFGWHLFIGRVWLWRNKQRWQRRHIEHGR